MNYSYLFLVLFIAGCCCQSTIVQWSCTPNTTALKSEFRNRITRARLINYPNAVGGILKSISKTLVNGEKELDGIRLAGFALNPPSLLGGVAPTASAAYYTKDVDVLNQNQDGQGFNFDVSTASNFVTLRFFSLEEVNPYGNIVNVMRLNTVTWSIVNTTAPSTEQQVNIPYVTIGGTISGINIQISFIATGNLCTMNIPGLNGGALVSPKGMEVLFAANLQGYTYVNSTNNLRLVTYTATGSASRQVNITSPNPILSGQNNSIISSIINSIPANIRFDQRATLLGDRVFFIAPNMTTTTNLNVAFNGSDVSLQINTFFGANVQLTRTNVPLPAGSNGIYIYDPTVSFGTDPTQVATVASPASTIIISSILLLVLFFFLI